MSLLIIAGEASGDHYGANIIKAIKHDHPTKRIVTVGGPKMEAVSDTCLSLIAQHHAIGSFEAWQKRALFQKMCDSIESELKTGAIEKAVIIDFAQQNFKLGHLIQSYNVPITTVITPNFWIWKNKKQSKKLAEYSQDIVTIYAQEYEWYTQFHPRVHFFGHPLLVDLPPLSETNRPIKKEDQSSTIPCHIGVFPGSRLQEITTYLPTILEGLALFQELYPQATMTISVPTEEFQTIAEHALHRHQLRNITVSLNNKAKDFEAIDLLITASGSTTLEGALRDKPMIVVGAISPLSYFIAKYLLRIKVDYISLPNVLLQAPAVVELVQQNLTAKNIAHQLSALTSPDNQAKQHEWFKQLRTQLKPNPNIFADIAQIILK